MAGVLFADPFRRLLLSPASLRRSGLPAADWLETPSAHIIRVDVPGFGREEIKLQLEEGNVLHVKGEPASSASAAEKDALWHVAERAEKEEFSRRFGLPDGIKGDQIRAQVENGVVTVVAPKEVHPAKLKPRAIPISSKL
ncbi:16.0 kDa heat shock protein, peroxisomal [Dendrobium catenatum]|uniref:16.0 kDa heat shock protein, peroxisomal n=1 Tax=Dendrobium catenatum TaxID=906689 RepID=A0A2I0WJ89_9ASPA|nr:16.0 kDa heat shock protein, peroxisomal [Dendrobium catenatum]XP_028552349.1 16.0 kDa heat shock protein, peroxisomal [Dendrobium catenatum]PKU75726.1 16.0 kDa heat shock protein, peroxisomal [Dendrobium catenatum]